MHANVSISFGLIFGFLLTLIRVSGLFVFFPIPGSQAGPSVARVAFALACTFALAPLWPTMNAMPGTGLLIGWVIAEATLGLMAGVALTWMAEIFTLGAQILSVQAGYSFASTFDPNTQADSGILQIFAQLMAGLLFFATGLDGQMLRALARSLEICPPGTFMLDSSMATILIHLGGEVFGLALRLALPVIGLLFLVDLVLGVLGRVNSHIQIISLSFPVKMLVSLIVLAALLTVYPLIYRQQSARVLSAIASMTVRR